MSAPTRSRSATDRNPDRLDGDLIQQVLQQMQHGCSSRPVLLHREDIAFPYSDISRLTIGCDGASRVVYLKRRKHGGGSDDVARRRILSEYEVLKRLSAHFAPEARFGAVKPIAAFPDHLAILTEAAPGMSLMGLIGKGARWSAIASKHALEEYCAASGMWLREFQSLTQRGPGAFDLRRLVGYCDARFDVLIADGRCGIDEELKTRFEAHLRKKYHASKATLDVITGCHHDFSPHNIFASPDRICVIDFGQFDYGSRLYDACRFWFQLECMKSSPAFRKATIHRLQHAFLSAYDPSVDPRHPAFAVVVSGYYLARLASLARNGMRGGMRGWIDRSLYRRCLAWVKQQCDDSLQ